MTPQYQIAGQLANGNFLGDYLFWGAATDGLHFGGYQQTGITTALEPPQSTTGRTDTAFDLTQVPRFDNQGNFLGYQSLAASRRCGSPGSSTATARRTITVPSATRYWHAPWV
jgi:hypothetical protein